MKKISRSQKLCTKVIAISVAVVGDRMAVVAAAVPRDVEKGKVYYYWLPGSLTFDFGEEEVQEFRKGVKSGKTLRFLYLGRKCMELVFVVTPFW